MPKVCFIGTGCATDLVRGPTSLVYQGKSRILCDCGPSVPERLVALGYDVNALDALYISHAHADHCFGLPTLLLWMRLGGRRRALTLLLPAPLRVALDDLLERGYPGSFGSDKCFALERRELYPEQSQDYAGLGLSIAPTRHRMLNHALRIDGEGSFAYSGDGVPSASAERLYEGVDCLVHECAFLVADGAHQGADGLLSLVARCAPKRVAALHCDAMLRSSIAAALAADARVSLPENGEIWAFGAPASDG